MPRKTDFQVNFDTNSSIAMHVIAQFEAVNISITPCLRICISTTDYPTHTAFSPSPCQFMSLSVLYQNHADWSRKFVGLQEDSSFLPNHIRRHSDLISIARYDVIITPFTYRLVCALLFAWLCVSCVRSWRVGSLIIHDTYNARARVLSEDRHAQIHFSGISA